MLALTLATGPGMALSAQPATVYDMTQVLSSKIGRYKSGTVVF